MHAHAHPLGLPGCDDEHVVRLRVEGDQGRLMLGGRVFRTVTPTTWDPARRVADLDAAGIFRQVVSPVPVNLAYDTAGQVLAAHLRGLNDGLADFSRRTDGRVDAWAGVPLQDVALAVAELDYAVRDLGMRGVEIGTRVNDLELDDPSLLPFFEAAEALGAVVFVHPLDGGSGAIRRSGPPYDFGLGMLTDTAMAAGALVLGGVLSRFPRLRVLLAHGGGAFPWAWPRLVRGSRLLPDAPSPEELAESVGRLWVDSLTFEPAHMGVLCHHFGAGNLVLGTDHPFIAGQLGGAAGELRSAVELGLLDEKSLSGALADNALRLLDS